MKREVDPEEIETVPVQGESSTRGRSKKREKKTKRSTKKKNPFSHIGSSIVPFAAVASASPNAAQYIGKSRSPSPIARAIAFAGRIGHAIAGGYKLERSLSEKDVYEISDSKCELAGSRQISKSNPGPSMFYESEVEAGYESVNEVRLKLFAKNDLTESSAVGRLPVPLPDEEDGKERSDNVDELYAKVVKHEVVINNAEGVDQNPEDDSDDLTTISEADEEISSKIFVIKTKSKQQGHYIEDSSSGPSDGEVYRLPFDAIRNTDQGGIQFQTIEEMENEDMSARSRRGLISPSSARSKGSSRDSTHLPPMHSSRSTHSNGNERRISTPEMAQERLSPRPHTPREMGREAALRRLEELGFDGINREFGLVVENENEQRYDHLKRSVSYETEMVPTVYEESFYESSPRFDYRGKGKSSNSSEPKKRNPVIEDPLVESAEMPQQFSSHEMMLEELQDENQQSAMSNGSDFKNITRKSEPSMNDMNHQEYESRQKSTRNVTKGGSTTVQDRDGSADISPREMHRTHGEHVGNARTERSLQSKALESGNLQMQEEMQQKQDTIIKTIEALEKQFETMAEAVASNRQDTKEQEEKLALIRKLIKEEQDKYIKHQKILAEQQQNFLKEQRLISARNVDHSRFSSTPLSHQSPEKSKQRASYFEAGNRDQFKMLENRLKTVEAERNALYELNSSLEEENDTLKKLAFNVENGINSSGIVFKKQNAELIESNKNLKSLVHRLNVELSRYQAKYRPPRREEIEGLALPEAGPIPEWLVNMKYLSPLVMAYDDRLRDKTEVIHVYETQLTSIKEKMLELIRENQKLHLMNNERPDENEVDFREWNLLQEQAKLVVDENAILMQEIELKDRRIDEMQHEFEIEVDQLTKKLRFVENERRNARASISSLQIDNEALKKHCREVEAESTNKMTVEELKRRLEKVERPLTAKIEYFEKEKDDFESRFQAVLKEKQELAVKLTDANGKSSLLQTELDLVSRSLRKLEKKFTVLQHQLEIAKEKEFTATETLAQVLSVAEKNSNERDEFAKMVESQNNETIINYKHMMQEEEKMEILKRELDKFKKLAKKNAYEMQKRMNEKEEEITNMQNSFNKEISNLKEIIRERQKIVDRFQTDGRRFENEIDVLWQSINEENEEFRKSLP